MNKYNTFSTSLNNLESLKKLGFIIPSYQRPYVWGDVEISKLLSDFYKSYCTNKDLEYYVGTILTKEKNTEAELIDGQQRFTTLWLIAFSFWLKNSRSEIEQLLYTPENTIKLSFEIRTEVANHFKRLIESKNNPDMAQQGNEKSENHPYLNNIARALSSIKSIIDEKIPENELCDFGNFIYKKVHFIKNTTPENIDLNKLFSTINSAGIQLEQTDIIKSNLLRVMDEKVLYGKIWEACEDMNNFFERNIRISFPNTDWNRINLSEFIPFRKDTFLYADTQSGYNTANAESFTIDAIDLQTIESYKEPDKTSGKDDRKSEEIYCRSIINFGQLLLHTYRIHLKLENKPDFEGTFHVNRVIEIFNNLTEPEEIKRFILRLWDVRLLFDKYIVKWVSDTDTKIESLELLNINKNSDNYYSRTPYEKPAMLMLQSVLYFTGDYLRQYWLTPYLYFLLQNRAKLNANDSSLLNHLEKIDNQLSLSELQDKEATFRLCNEELNPDFDFVKYLNEGNHGTKFKHYWFQKLEYILWKKWPENNKSDAYRNFRITSKNSVEHIYPQNPENRAQHPIIDKDSLDSFGNLVLLSVSQNSEYSNKSVKVKRSMFEEKRNTYDSLKSFQIFKDNKDWNTLEIDDHKEEMIQVLVSHYNTNEHAV